MEEKCSSEHMAEMKSANGDLGIHLIEQNVAMSDMQKEKNQSYTRQDG